jgi:uncharacterized membrane protein
MNAFDKPAPKHVRATRWLAVGSLLGLIALGLAWELFAAPLRPGGSWLALKVPVCSLRPARAPAPEERQQQTEF